LPLFFLQPTPKGGGIAIEAPAEDRADGSSDRGFLEQINITIVNTLIEGNVAQEGGGVWSAWPMDIRNTIIRGNLAAKAVSNRDLLSMYLLLLCASGCAGCS
jgi:hypothetical protein